MFGFGKSRESNTEPFESQPSPESLRAPQVGDPVVIIGKENEVWNFDAQQVADGDILASLSRAEETQDVFVKVPFHKIRLYVEPPAKRPKRAA